MFAQHFLPTELFSAQFRRQKKVWDLRLPSRSRWELRSSELSRSEWDNPSVEMSVRNYHHSLRNKPYKKISYYFLSNYVSSMNISSSTTECDFQEFIATHSMLPSHKLILSISVVTTCSDMLNIQQDRQCTYKRNNESRSCKHCCSGKAISITYSECVLLALFISHAISMPRIMLPSVVCLTVTYFSTLSHNRHDLRKEDRI